MFIPPPPPPKKKKGIWLMACSSKDTNKKKGLQRSSIAGIQFSIFMPPKSPRKKAIFHLHAAKVSQKEGIWKPTLLPLSPGVCQLVCLWKFGVQPVFASVHTFYCRFGSRAVTTVLLRMDTQVACLEALPVHGRWHAPAELSAILSDEMVHPWCWGRKGK